MLQRMKDIYAYRNTIYGLVKRDLRGRYKGSFLGFLWNFINPLCQILVYIMVFVCVFKNQTPNYYMFLMSAMMPWNFFAESLTQGSQCVIGQSNLTSKMYFPREILTIATVTSRFINLLLTFIVIFVLIFISGMGVNAEALLYLPLILIVEYILTLGITLILSAITVYFRDVAYMTSVIIMALIWATPVLYSVNEVDGILQKLIMLNPLTPLMEAYRTVIYYKSVPDVQSVLICGLYSLVVLIIGEIIFCRLEGDFAEQL